MNLNRVFRIGVGVVIGALVITGFMVTTGGGADDGTAVVTLADAGQLEEGAEVRASGVRVGEVTEIRLAEGKARLTVKLSEGVLPLHTDASVKIKPVNLLGENYLDLDPGSDAAPYAKTAKIPEDRTATAVTLQDVLNTFEDPTAAGLASVVTTLGEGLDGNGGELAKALKLLSPAMRDTAEVGGLLSDQNEVLASLVKATDPVVASLAADNGKTLDSLVGSTRDALGALAHQQEALEQSIRDLPATLTSAQQTLTRLGSAAKAGAPTLRALRPLTGDLEDVVGELRHFAESADPALASLEPVLDEAEALLDTAAPIVAQLRQAGPDLASAASSLKPTSQVLLDDHLQDVMDFVRKWALSTNGRDGLSHYFRGVVYVTPSTLKSLANSLIPLGTGPAANPPAAANEPAPATQGLDGVVGGLLDSLGNLLGSGSPKASDTSGTDPTSALGLTTQQEQSLLSQLLGGKK
jgi:phospholipid/cholesterol/gamma-HCH transport system substrate-binding protein